MCGINVWCACCMCVYVYVDVCLGWYVCVRYMWGYVWYIGVCLCVCCKPSEKGKTSANPQGKLDPLYLASMPLICKLPLCTQDPLAIVLTLCHYAKWRAIEKSIYCCLEWKSRRQNCSGAESNLFMGFHFPEVGRIPPPPSFPSACSRAGVSGLGVRLTPDGTK